MLVANRATIRPVCKISYRNSVLNVEYVESSRLISSPSYLYDYTEKFSVCLNVSFSYFLFVWCDIYVVCLKF